jgi:hypothetical protein
MSKKLKIVILGMMGRCPFGGQTWLYLNWLRGFQRLGHEVWYIEDDSVWPYHPRQNTVTDDCSYAVHHIETCMERIGIPNQWAFRLADRKGTCFGMSDSTLDDLYRSCDLLLNVVGATDLREEHLRARLRVYLESDPVSAELQLANGDEHTRKEFAKYDHIFTYGENYGANDCGVPLNGIKYGKTRQPVDLDLWPMAYDPEARFFTTIGNFRQNGNDIVYRGELYYWSKHYEWEKFLGLPLNTRQSFELAMNCEGEDRQRLQAGGWNLVSPLMMSLDVFGAYPDYFRQSRGEFTVAKDQNVRLRSGWFSERDACYLASGKPVIAQDTGFGNILPSGEGLFAFATMEQALAAIQAINGDYRRHCETARAIAEEYFAAPKVAAKLLQDLGL